MKIALCCVGKAENEHIREFIEFYQNYGIDHIFLYDNNTDSKDINVPCGTEVENKDKEEHFETVISDYIESGFVELIYYRNQPPQETMIYQECYDNHQQEYDWIMFFDCNEFIELTDMNPCSLKDYLGQSIFDNYGVIQLNVIETNQNDSLDSEYTSVNSIVRGGLTDINWCINKHTPSSNCRFCNGNGVELYEKNSGYKEVTTEGAYIKQIIYKSKMTKNNQITIEAHIICFNEERITPFAIQYWKRNFSHVYIYDNGSTDDTLNIIREQMPNATIYHFDTNNEFNDAANISIKNNCWKNSTADFVVVSDFDEFIYSPNLQEELQYMIEHKMNIARLTGFDMVCDEFPKYDKNKLSLETIQMGSLNEMMCKPILFNPKSFKEINYCCGAHFCKPNGETRWYDRNKIFLLHHKFLSLLYMAGRYLYLGKRLSQFNKDGQMGVQYFWDEERKKEEFDFTKNTAINVWEYVQGNIEKEKPSKCVSVVDGTTSNMLFQIQYGVYYANKFNKDLYLYVPNKINFQILNKLRPTVLKKIRYVDNINLLTPEHYTQLTTFDMLNNDHKKDVLININDNEFIGTPSLIKNALCITEELINDIQTLYSDIDFAHTLAIYVEKNNITATIYEAHLNQNENYKLLFLSNDMEWLSSVFNQPFSYHANRLSDKYPKEVIDLVLPSLCNDINTTSCDFARWTYFIKQND